MTDRQDLDFLSSCGVQLRAALDGSVTHGSADLHRIARSTVLDLLGARHGYANPILEILDRLISTPSGGSVPASLAAIEQQLQLTYNAQTTAVVMGFARGFLGLANPIGPVNPAELPHPPSPVAAASAGANAPASLPVLRSGAPALATFNQSLLLLTALVSISVIGVLAIRMTSPPAAAPARHSEGGTGAPATPAATTTPAPAALAQRAAPPAPPAAGAELYDAGMAVGGQRVQLDLSSLSPTQDPSRLRFRYWLGNQSIDAAADCRARTWTTYPEAETHSPRSAATERMLSRVCGGADVAPPVVSATGAAIVFDPPSNIRSTPNGAILCSVTSRGTIPIQGRSGAWYRTDFCGSPGYIHQGQIRF